MKKCLIACALVLAAPVFVLAGDGHDHAKEKAGNAMAGHEMDGMSMDAMMEEWTKMAAPGEHHKDLAYFAGNWTTKDKHWMGGPDAMETTGTASYEMVMGGRYLKYKYSSQMMGQEFQGMGFTGWDNTKNMYWGTWMDNMSTGCMMSTGQPLDGSKGHEMTGTMNDPMMGGEVPYRMVTKIMDNNTFVLEMYMTPPGGEETKSMEITHTRVAS